MPDEFNEELLEELEPLDPGLVDADEALDVSEGVLEGEADATLLVAPQPTPLGQTISWDFLAHQRHGTANGPHMVRGDAALEQWIHKCLRTHEGAHPIHPEGYGMRTPITALIGLAEGEVEVGELEEEIREALTFHPTITDVTDFKIAFASEDLTGDAGLELGFRVVKDDDTSFRFDTSLITGEVETGALV